MYWYVSIWIMFVSMRLMWHIWGAIPSVTAYTNDFVVVDGMPVLININWLWPTRFVVTISWW